MNKHQKEFTKIFIVFYLLAFVAINWNDVSWVFNYRTLGGIVYDFFNPYQDSKLLVQADNTDTLVHSTVTSVTTAQATVQTPATKAPNYPYSEKSNSVEIPTLGITTPMIVGQSTENSVLVKELDKGVVYYPGSVFPGENGQIVVLGHSAPPNWPKIKHDWVFSNISNLKDGDQIVMYFNNHQYTYRVFTSEIIQAGQDVGTQGLTGSNNVLVIVSCWPPGKNYKRIAVYAELMVN